MTPTGHQNNPVGIIYNVFLIKYTNYKNYKKYTNYKNT